ncbi:hypothetical protein [Desulfoluna spongiiphila]|uniref:Uncharacterized protein n=1 Tax=Desulfoluna spongiiphila TaxID=419481 RepID=A0A1G5HVB2_9BACT|nr:hypothetical protein [Desulfoluna spongiiphila]SCY67631.1 hypothetical protein SAMN05216233_1164 [Desulfoluna spongiiphila]
MHLLCGMFCVVSVIFIQWIYLLVMGLLVGLLCVAIFMPFYARIKRSISCALINNGVARRSEYQDINKPSYGRPIILKQGLIFLSKNKIKMVFWPLCVVCVVNVIIYNSQRNEWIRKDAHHTIAREYFVAGQVVNAFRSMTVRFVHPENKLLYPYNLLQEIIFNRGVRYLPANDGEAGVWVDLWFVGTYSRSFYLTRDESGTGKTPHDMIRLIDLSWYSINKCMTNSFESKKMEEVHFMRNIPRMLFYYSLYKNYSIGIIFGSRESALSDEVLNYRINKIAKWTGQIRIAWNNSEYMKVNIDQHPKLEATLSIVELLQLRDIIYKQIRDGVFDCSDTSVLKYKEIMEDLILNPKSSLRKVKNRTQRKRLFVLAMKPYAADFLNDYVLKKHCGYPIHRSILDINRLSLKELQYNFKAEIEKLN